MDPLSSPRTTYAACSAALTIFMAAALFGAPAYLQSILEPGNEPSTDSHVLPRAFAIASLPLAFHQVVVALGKHPPKSTAYFYTWFGSIAVQIVLFITSYIRYIEPRPYYARLSTAGTFGWGGLLVTAGGLAASGIWCLLFADEVGASNGKIRSSSWLFPTKEKRKEKVERREKKFGSKAIK